MKVILISVLSVACISHLFSQDKNKFEVGLQGGPVFAKVAGPDLFPGDYKYKSGYELSMAFRYHQNRFLFYETAVGFTRAGYLHTYKSTLVTMDATLENSYLGFEYRYHQDYIHNTWLVGCYFGNKLRLVLETGIYWAYMLQKKARYTDFIYFDEDDSDLTEDPLPPGYSERTESGNVPEELYNKPDYGIIVGCGLYYGISEKIKVSIIPSFRNGIRNISNNDAAILDQRYYNRIIGIRAGVDIIL